MRSLLLLVLLASPLAASPPVEDAPNPRIRSLAVTTRAQGSAVWVKGCWTAAGNPDSILTGLTGASTQSHRLRATAGTCDSFSVTAPAVAQTISGTFTSRAKRRALLSGIVSRPYSYTTPDVPPPDPVIDSIVVRPASVTVEASTPGEPTTERNTAQFCAFMGFRSGAIAFRRAIEGSIATCDSIYRTLPAAVRVVSAEEQAMADAACIAWTATGGTITSGTCGPNPAVRFAPDVKRGVIEVEVVPRTRLCFICRYANPKRVS